MKFKLKLHHTEFMPEFLNVEFTVRDSHIVYKIFKYDKANNVYFIDDDLKCEYPYAQKELNDYFNIRRVWIKK